MQKPFLKWAGGKTRLIKEIKEVIPEGKRLIEPFIGSGAVFLNLYFDKYLLSDSNQDLINLYQILVEEGADFVELCRTYFVPENNVENKYYELRDEFNHTRDLRTKSALFIYLNRHCFNGLCRYNADREFNIPFGKYDNSVHFPAQTMMEFYRKCKDKEVHFKHQDFREAFKKVRKGDIIYCDPPYVPISATSSFTAYDGESFNERDQEDLAELASSVSVPVIISNSCTEYIKKLYNKAIIREIWAGRVIAGDRQAVKEILAVFNYKCPDKITLFSTWD